MFNRILSEFWIVVNIMTICALIYGISTILMFYLRITGFIGDKFLLSWGFFILGLFVYGMNKFLSNPPIENLVYQRKLLYLNSIINPLLVTIGIIELLGSISTN